MSLAIAARFARRELRGGLRGIRIFLACLALGVAAIAAVGLKTSLKDVIDVGPAAIALLVVETAFIGGFTVAGLYWIGF